ncbi:MAG: amidohydrolase family protein, partial [Gammaproteobacteria bacterium]
MNKQAAIAAVIALTSILGACEAPQPVDLILTDARVYNADRRDSLPSTLVIDNGRILAVGDGSLLERYEGPTRALSGRLVLPGFHDSHTHLIYGGRQLMQCDLSGLVSIAAIQSKLADCDSALDPEEWLLGGGWNLSLFPDANPNRSTLDAINPDRATVLVGEDGHSTWASSRALALAGITAETPNPPDGVIERDPSGSPSGTLRETAQNLVHAYAPAMLVDDVLIGAERAIQMAHQFGITSAIDAATTTEDIEIYEQLKASGALSLRMVLAITMNDPGLGIGSRADIDVSERGNVEALRTDAAKIFVDGVLEGETAALIEPYDSH